MTRRFIIVSFILFLVAIAGAALVSGCGNNTEPFGTPLYVHNPNPNINPTRYITSIVVQPSGVNLAVGGSQQFTALATFSDGTQENVAGGVEWYAENPNIGKFTQTGGRFLAQRPGVAIVRCRIQQGGQTFTSAASFVNSFNPNSGIPPAVPRNPNLFVSPEGVRVGWDRNVTDGDLAGYNIYRTQTSNAHYATEITRVNESLVLYPPFLDKTVVSGWYYYRVTAEDLSGGQSAPSEEVSVFITAQTHYGNAFDGGISTIDDAAYRDAFSTAF